MNFNATYSGRVYELFQGEIYTLRADGRFASAGVEYDYTERAVLTGYTATSNSGNIGYQTTSGGYILLNDGWQEIGTQAIAKHSQTQAQALVDKIIKNNITILQNNLVCARFANRFTAQEQAQIRALQNRMQARNNALQAGGLNSNIQTSYPAGYAELSASLDKLMAGESIGLTATTWLVIAAVVIAATATAAYFAYKELAEESEKDVKFSKELTATLTQKLTPEEYEQLKAETKGIVTKARLKQSLSSYGNVLTWLAIGAAGLAAYKFAQKYF